jgi:hypothetical protein
MWSRLFTKKHIWIVTRDDNEDPIPDSPREIPLLGDGDGKVSCPHGYKRKKTLPRRVNGNRDVEVFLITVSYGDPLNLHVTTFSCTSY